MCAVVSTPDPDLEGEKGSGELNAFLILASSVVLFLRKPIRLQLYDFHVILHLITTEISCTMSAELSWKFIVNQSKCSSLILHPIA